MCVVCMIHASAPAMASATENQGPRFRVESSLAYEHFSRNKVVLRGVSFFDLIHIGDFRVIRVKRDMVGLNTRIGYIVSPQMRVEAMVPLRYRRELVALENPSDHEGGAIDEDDERLSRTREVQGAGLGDVELALHLALPPAELGRIFSVGVKMPTGKAPYGLGDNEVALGSGHWSGQLGLHLQKVIDPVVLFGSVGYTHPFGREARIRGEKGPQWVLPGPSIRYTLGVGLAVNPRVVMTAMLEHVFTRPTRVGQKTLKESETNSAVFSLGVRYQWPSGRAMRVQVGLGLTSDAPDFTVMVDLPFSYSW